MNRNIRAALQAASALAAIAAAAHAHAQETTTEERDSIIVTAQQLNQTTVVRGGSVGIFGIAGEVFVIRGFELASDDVGFEGLYGITPRQLVAPELFSSVQVINGASAFLNGAAPGGSGIGGSVNLVSKQADRMLSRATVGYTSDAHFSGAFDIARRFGANDEWGLRVNGSARRGDIAIDDEFHSSYVLGGTLDYNSGPLRMALNVNYQRLRQSNWRPKVGISTFIPRPAGGRRQLFPTLEPDQDKGHIRYFQHRI